MVIAIRSSMRWVALMTFGAGLVGPTGVFPDSGALTHAQVISQGGAQSLEEQQQGRFVEAVYLNQQGWDAMDNGRTAEALASFEKALAIFRELKSIAGEAQALDNLATLQYRLGKLPEALKLYQQALPLRRANQHREGEWATLDGLADTYVALGELERGLEFYQQALTIVRELKDIASETYRLQKIAAVYFRLGQYDRALTVYQQTLILYRQNQDLEGVIVSLNNIGMAQTNLGQYAKAIASYQEALAILEPLTAYRGARAVILNNMAGVFYSLGQNAQALDFAQQAIKFQGLPLRPSPDPDVALVSRLSLLHARLGQHGAPIELSRQGITIHQVEGSRWSLERSLDLSRAHTLNNVARVHANLGEYAQAIKLYQEALAIFQANQDLSGQAAVLNNLGQAEQGQEKAESALKYYQQALTLYRQLRDRTGEGIVLSNLGQTYSQLKQYAQAQSLYEQALVIHQEVSDRPSEAVTQFKIAASQYQAGDLVKASQTLQENLTVLESLRPGLTDAQKVSLFETQSLAYSLLQSVLVQQRRYEEALVVAERGRARAFVEMLARRNQEDNRATVPENLALGSLTIDQIRQIARDQKATLVQYTVISGEKNSGDRLYIWVVSPSGQIHFRESQLPSAKCLAAKCPAPTVAGLVNLGRDSMGVPTRGLTFTQGAVVTAPAAPTEPTSPRKPLILDGLQVLHRVLIQPIADLLPSDSNAQVIFLPHQSLFMVPFAALQDSQGRSLIERHTLRIAPSLQVLQLTHQRRQGRLPANPASMLIVGNPKMPKVRVVLGEPPQELSSLPGAETEARTIGQLLNTSVLIGEQASETEVVNRINQASLIHLATHGLLDDFEGLGFPGAIALTADSRSNGLLTASEILDLQLKANLVVLSACDTGRGRITGDGVVGLSRSLIIAGASTVIVSLWKVPDGPTASLMTEFYRHLQQNPDKAIALRKAMLTTAQQYPDPYDWAAFVLLGEAE